ncbi:MAG: hypothetical protein M1813_008127 [Trichoglossum hirsutum]|nr:MAG: hypothetical protein M1813_008127 [Trichoglossum hirsutum]
MDIATSNHMPEPKRLSLPQMPAALEEQPTSSCKCFWSRSKSPRRPKSTRSSLFLLKERPKGGVFDPDKLGLPRKAQSLPTRPVSRIFESFPSILRDKQPTARGFESRSQSAPPKLRLGEDAYDSTRKLGTSSASEIGFRHSMSTNLCNSPSSITFLDMGMFLPPENGDLQALYLQVQKGDPILNCADCPCSPQGSPCEEVCIFEDYAETGSAPLQRFSCPPGLEIDALRAPAQVETATFETEGSWLAGQTDCSSWLDDSSSCEERESETSQARNVQRRLPRVLSWMSDSSDSSFGENSFQYATALAPSRPKLVNISTYSPSSENVSALTHESPARTTQLHSGSQPISPPTTPVDERPLGTGSDRTSIWDTSGRLDHRTSQQTSGSPTPPTTPEGIHRPLTLASEGVPRIISMLEDSTRMFPSTMLQLHTAPMTLIRRIPSPYLPPPRSSRSGLPIQSTPSSSRPPPVSKNPHPNIGTDEAATGIAIFRRIFSNSSNSTDFLHTTLYAHLLALNFLSDLVSTPFEHPPIQFPPKALSTLGAIEPVEGQGQLYDRVVKVSTALRECVGRLLEACCGSRLDETLLKALREIVRLMESRDGRREHF